MAKQTSRSVVSGDIVDIDDLDSIADAGVPAVPDASQPKPAKAKTITEQTDADAARALRSLGDATQEDRPREQAMRETLIGIRDRIQGLKGNRQYWERLDYSHRQVLNGALALVLELLGEKDAHGLPLTISRFLGVKIPGF